MKIKNKIISYYKNFKNNLAKLPKKLVNSDDSHEFKPILSEIIDSPVSPLGRTTFWIIVSLLVFSALWLFFGQVDIVVTARGIVIPDGESKIIQPLDTGVISKIFIQEGDFVKKGQALIEIDPSTTKSELNSLTRNLSELKLEIQRLEAISENKKFTQKDKNNTTKDLQIQKQIYHSNLEALKKQLNIKKIELNKTEDKIISVSIQKNTYQDLLKSQTEKKERLYKVIDVIAYDEYQETINKIKTYKAEISKLNYETKDLLAKKEQLNDEMNYIKENFKSENLERLAEKQKQATQLEAETEKIIFKNAKQTINAPCNGHIDKLLLHTIGGVVTPAQKLIKLTPSDVELIVKAKILNQDIGFVKEKMPVSIKIDTFNFQKYGLLEGKIKSISKNSIIDENLGPVYEVKIQLLKKHLLVEGKEESIKPGMTLNAEIKVGKRKIIDFFVYPLIKYLDEGISVR